MCPPVRSADGVFLISEFVEAVEAVIQEKQGALAWAAEHKPSVPGCTEAAKAAIAAQAAVDRGVEEAQKLKRQWEQMEEKGTMDRLAEKEEEWEATMAKQKAKFAFWSAESTVDDLRAAAEMAVCAAHRAHLEELAMDDEFENMLE